MVLVMMEDGTATRTRLDGLEVSMRVLALAAAALLVAPVAADAEDTVLEGRGWGHGVGLSQYGAYGYALREGRDHEFILGHFYQGTDLGRAPSTRIRVRLKAARALSVCGATRALDAGGHALRLSDARTYRVRPAAGGRLVVRGRRLLAPVRFTGGTSTCLRGAAENGVTSGSYRGRMVLAPEGSGVVAVNHISLEQYLYGVVPGEMPSDWPAEALAAQAVVARSYALRGLRPASSFDVFADVRSQMYRGIVGEAATTTAAVRATRREVVTAGGEIAQTFYFSTSGGQTVANEEEWGGTPISYLRSVEDPHDDLSPYHTWDARFTARRAGRLLRGLYTGAFQRLEVASRTSSGRAATVGIVARGGTNAVPAATIRSRLGLRSTWFDVVD
jgi:stage II sporulation protein D